jgi:hypothetical protein
VSAARDIAHRLTARGGREVTLRGASVVRITGCRSWTDLELADGTTLQFDVDAARIGALLGTPATPLVMGRRR